MTWDRTPRSSRQAREQAASKHPVVRQAAGENERLAALRTGPDGALARQREADEQLARLRTEVEQLNEDVRDIRADIAAAGITETMGQVLRERRKSLEKIYEYRRRIELRKTELAKVRRELVAMQRQQADLADVDGRVRREMSAVDGSAGAEELGEIRATLGKLLTTRKGILSDLVADYEKYRQTLIQLNLAEEDLLAKSQAFADFIDENILWVRSQPPLELAELSAAWEAACWLAGPDNWADLARWVGRDAGRHPILYALAGLLLAGMLLTRRRATRRIVALGKGPPDAGHLLAGTFQAAALTAWTALPWPTLLGFAAWRLGGEEGSAFARAIAAGLQAAAVVLLTLQAYRQVCLPDGLGQRHFHWSPTSLATVRMQLLWVLPVVLPLLFVVAAMDAQAEESYRGSLGRVAFIVGLAAVGVFLHRLLRPGGAVMQRLFTRSPDGWTVRLRYLWLPLVVGGPFALAGVAGFGYYYSALQLAYRLMTTLWLLLGLTVVYGLIMRWLFLNRQKIALEQARRRRAAAQREPAREGEPGPADVHDETVNLVAVSEQARKLISSLMAAAMLLGLWFIWRDVLPALRILQTVHLWSYATDTGSAAVTLGNLLLALLIVVVTSVAARNIPGLLEIAVLRNLPLQPAVRFAVITLARYLIFIVGLIVAFGAIGVGWSKVQWLAAAITVGLGFGLQEIFANFVSGLILLFERPIRVGDVVTVNDITGTVTRIRIRATTIADWDRRELIVPNKAFITGQIINWTLSDRVSRLTLTIGVAYGSDIELAKRLVLQAALEHPNVMKEPAPTVFLEGFGDSSLELCLRAFLPTLSHRLVVRDDLCTRILADFRRGGIEIPFPQRDIHIRTAAPPGPSGPQSPPDAGPQ